MWRGLVRSFKAHAYKRKETEIDRDRTRDEDLFEDIIVTNIVV